MHELLTTAASARVLRSAAPTEKERMRALEETPSTSKGGAPLPPPGTVNASALHEKVLADIKLIRYVAQCSKRLKGTCQGALNTAAASIATVSEELSSRLRSEESDILKEENRCLRSKVEEMKRRLEDMERMMEEMRAWSRALVVPPPPFLRTGRRCGGWRWKTQEVPVIGEYDGHPLQILDRTSHDGVITPPREGKEEGMRQWSRESCPKLD